MKRIGLLGCGAIGSELARRITTDRSWPGRINGVYDKIPVRARTLAFDLGHPEWMCRSLAELLERSQIIVEAVASPHTHRLIGRALRSGCDVLCLSVGAVWLHPSLFRLAQALKRRIVIPSGALAALDGLKAAAHGHIESVRLTTRKPPRGFTGNPYLRRRNITPERITRATVVFDGEVGDAVKHFPRNINVAAAVGLAAGRVKHYRVTIIADPKVARNEHTLEVKGDFGRLVCRVQNIPLALNPKTSRLAVLAAVAALRQMCDDTIHVGT